MDWKLKELSFFYFLGGYGCWKTFQKYSLIICVSSLGFLLVCLFGLIFFIFFCSLGEALNFCSSCLRFLSSKVQGVPPHLGDGSSFWELFSSWTHLLIDDSSCLCLSFTVFYIVQISSLYSLYVYINSFSEVVFAKIFPLSVEISSLC